VGRGGSRRRADLNAVTQAGAPEPKVVITGTGRAGTTLLVSVLTALGLDTGEKQGAPSRVDPRSHGGLELLLESRDAPLVVKDTTLPFRFAGLLESGAVAVEHVIVPIRQLDLAAASRLRASNYGRNIFARGGLWGTVNPVRQRDALAVMLYELMFTLARFEVPHTLLEFPRFTTDADYTYRRLGFLTPDRTLDDYRNALASVVDTTLIHQQELGAREQRMVRRQALRLRLNGAEKRVKASVRKQSGES
jgi:hypothetical protein